MKKIFSQIDQQLLVNYPNLWATKLHSFLFAYIFIMIGTLLIGFTFPISTANVPEVETHFVYPFVLACIAYLIWAYKASLFQVAKQFGDISAFSTFKTQLVYLLITTILAAVPFVYVSILSFRVKHLVSNEELIDDCNILNVGMYYLTGNTNEYNIQYDSDWNLNQAEFSRYKVNGIWNHNEVVKNATNKELQLSAFIETVRKYGGSINETVEEMMENNDEHNSYVYDKYTIDEGFRGISKAKAGKFFFQDFRIYWGVLAGIFGLLFVAFTFLATSLRTFILSIIVGIIGSMVFGLFSAFVFRGGNEKGILLFYIVVVGALATFGIGGGSKVNTLNMREVALCIATVLTPFVPVALLALADLPDHMYRNSHEVEFFMKTLLILTIAGTWFIWQNMYLPALRKIQTVPVSN